MLDIRPVGNLVGWMAICLSFAMLFPLVLSIFSGDGNWIAWAISLGLTLLFGTILILATFVKNIYEFDTNNRQTFLMILSIYALLPLFGALPFVFGEPNLTIIDAYFETTSGLTTTGATVITNLENMPKGILLWRGLLQWIGGIVIIIFAMTILPRFKVAGAQFIMERNYDKMDNVLPDASTTAKWIMISYLVITILCFLSYNFAGLSIFDSLVHSMTTVATGGFGNYDRSFFDLAPRAEYVAIVFMIAASIPFILYVESIRGSRQAVIKDSQTRFFFLIVVVIAVVLVTWLINVNGFEAEQAFRKALFNGISILTGTGYVSDDYNNWGAFPIVVFFLIGLIGGCAGSTSCSIKVFRYQLLIAGIVAQIKKIITPNAIVPAKIGNRKIPNETLTSVILFFFMFMFTLVIMALLLSLTGLDFITSISGSAAAQANIGPGLGDIIGPSGNYQSLNDAAKIILSVTMIIGRLEFLVVYVIVSLKFWQT